MVTIHEIKSMVWSILDSNSKNLLYLYRQLEMMYNEGRISDSESLLAMVYAIGRVLDENGRSGEDE